MRQPEPTIDHDPLTVSTLLEDVLSAGVAWFDTEQPEDVGITHHGLTYPLGLTEYRMHVGFTPSGKRGPVVTIYAAKGGAVFSNGLTKEGERRLTDAVEEAAEKHDRTIDDTWNGYPSAGVSVGLWPRADRSLLAAVKKYRSGCPKCGGHFCDHDWIADLETGLIRPDWPDPDTATPLWHTQTD